MHWGMLLVFMFPLDVDLFGSPVPMASWKRVLARRRRSSAHSLRHGAKDLWERLEWVCELPNDSAHDIDWEMVIQQAKELGAERTLFLGLMLAKSLRLQLARFIGQQHRESALVGVLAAEEPKPY